MFVCLFICLYRAVANFTKSLDPNRPITAAIAVPANDDKAVSNLLHFGVDENMIRSNGCIIFHWIRHNF